MTLLRTHIEFHYNIFLQAPKELTIPVTKLLLIQYLCRELNNYGIQVLNYLSVEWGYIIHLDNEYFDNIWIGCTHLGPVHNNFLVFINSRTSFIKNFFIKNDVSYKVIQLSNILDKILNDHPLIFNPHWWNLIDLDWNRKFIKSLR
jgi:hypothetical protein